MSGNKPPKLLSGLTKPQIVHVAAVLYDTPMSLQPTVAVLRDTLAQIMRQRQECDNVGCNPGPCDPARHLFSSEQYIVNTGNVNSTLNELASASQRDSVSSMNEDDESLNPPADALKQRRDLIIAALAKEGLQLSDLSDILDNGRPRPVPASRSNISSPAAAHAPPREPPHRDDPSQRDLFGGAGEPPAGADQQSSNMSQMLAVLRQNAEDRKQELVLRQAQMDNTTRLLDLVTRRLDNAEAAPGAGRVEMVQPRNSAALLMAGVALPAQYSVVGDTSNMDLSKSKYKLKSGLAPATQQTPRVAEVWPHYYLDPLLFTQEVLHDQLTFSQWVMGFITKVYCEYDPTRNHTREHNMLHILMLMVRLAETHHWSDIRRLDETLFLALERGNLSWDKWDDLERWWNRAETTLRNKAVPAGGRTQQPPQPSKRPAPGETADPPTKKQKKGDVAGLAGDWLRKNGLCIKFQLGTCAVSAASHEIVQQGGSIQVKHACAGCIWLKKGDDGSHGAKSCKHRNSEGVFH